MSRSKIFALIVLLAAIGGLVYLKFFKKPEPFQVGSPINASYTIDGQVYNMVDGRAEVATAPDSTGSPQAGAASKNVLTIFGEPAIGDLNGDSVADIGMLLALDTGGSGTFYYVAAAILDGGEYQGTNAILLGDRIAPQNVAIENGKLMANYADRGPKDPMTVKPYLGVTKRTYVEGGVLKEMIILKGRIVWGDEVRTFQACAGAQETQDSVTSQWIEGRSPALAQIKSAYEGEMAGSGPFAPMYAEVVGKEVSVPQDGFGSDYEKATSIDELFLASAVGSCKRDLVVLTNIKPGDFIDAKKPLELNGLARGNWYFEASFPIQVLDRHANVLASGMATAQGEWMTTEFVPFKATLNFTQVPQSGSFGKIVLNKDNPSGDPTRDDALEVLVYFK